MSYSRTGSNGSSHSDEHINKNKQSPHILKAETQQVTYGH